jgi:prepilin-type N-terminal cleavage/methylation domain-containing protein
MGAGRAEAGFTLVELLVASAMGVVVMGAVASLLISAVKDQPRISKRAQNVSTARWVLERLTREIRNGVAVSSEKATPSEVSFRTYVRNATCAGGTASSSAPAIECQVTYNCTTNSCTRTQAAPGVYTGTARPIFTGINNSSVFTYTPSASEPTYIRITLHFPNPDGTGDLTISDGASLRNATLTN